jgi:uncharacterized membrane protein YedE/YeeE
MEPTQKLLLLGLAFSIPAGALINKSNFCTMGGVSDWINMGRSGRLWAWFFATGTAILAVAVMQSMGILSLSSTIPPYQTASFAWPRYMLGGFLFGIGMTLGGGCMNKTLVNIGSGNLKSLLVGFIASVMAYLMTKTDFYGIIFHGWISPLTIDLSKLGISSQSVPSLIGRLVGMESVAGTFTLVTGLVIGGALVLLAVKSDNFRSNFNNLLGGLTVGLAVAAAWYVTGGPFGREVIEAVEWMDNRPVGVGVQSLTFANPMGEFLSFAMAPSSLLITFGMTCAVGILLGSFLYTVATRKFRIQWFVSTGDAIKHGIGAVLMGIGGVLAMGCTIGQGVSGVSTLAIGSILTFATILFGSVLTMKIQYYQMVYEDEASFMTILPSVLADMHVLPQALRKLDRP